VYIGGNSPLTKNTDYRLSLTKNISYELEDTGFKGRSKNGKKGVFTRDRKLTIKSLVLLIMSANRAIQRELDEFSKKIVSSDYTIRDVTKGAFSQARSKLNAWAFTRLNEVAVDTFYNEAEYYAWHGKRLLAVDGTRMVLPNHPSIKAEFGETMYGPNADSPQSVAIASMLYDVLNQLVIDAQIAPFKSKNGERALLSRHIEKLEKGDLLLLDRGYPSLLLFFHLMAMGVDFCVRMKGSWWKQVRSFKESNETERTVAFLLPDKDKKKMDGYPGWADKPIECRLIKVELDTGETEILCTSLTDKEKYPRGIQGTLPFQMERGRGI